MELSEDQERLLKEVVEYWYKEDRPTRDRQLRVYRKLKWYWAGFTRNYSDVAHDWRVWDIQSYAQSYEDQGYYDKQVNVFRAYLESIIAALSVTIPGVVCYPDDADNSIDLDTAKAGDNIIKLLYRHNEFSLVWLHALFIYCTEGMVAAYNYPKEDGKKNGYYKEDNYETIDELQYQCPLCQSQVPNPIVDNEYMPEEETLCPECGYPLPNPMEPQKVTITRIKDSTLKAKARECIEAYGGLYVKVPIYARKQEDCQYLIYTYETHYTHALQRYPKLYGDKRIVGTGSNFDPYGRWARLSTQYNGEWPIDTVTIRNVWLRDSAFNIIEDETKRNELKKKFEKGCKVVMVNDCFAEACVEDLDDCWTLSYNPLSDYLQHDPLGLLLTSIQDITNDLLSLTIQTIEHGIPQTFVDSKVIDLDAYRQSEVAPGQIFPVVSPAGKSVGEAFYTDKTATLSAEVMPFGEKVQQLGQTVVGAQPSIFGGQNEVGSKTASEYSMQRAQALQRLQTVWKQLSGWWKNVMSKAVPSQMKEIMEDERFVDKDDKGNFLNVWIRKAHLQGKIGSIELESSEELPVSWSQKKDVLMQFMQAANPVVMEALIDPQNLPLLAKAIGLDEFDLPGSSDRTKQYEEIQVLSNSSPMGMLPSVIIEPLVDNHEVHIKICRSYLVGDAGRLLKQENPQGYLNIMLHLKQHLDYSMNLTDLPSEETEGNSPENQHSAAPEGKEGKDVGTVTH